MAMPKKIPGTKKSPEFTPPPLPDIDNERKIIKHEDEGEFVPLNSEEIEIEDISDEVQDAGLETFIDEQKVQEERFINQERYDQEEDENLYDDPFEEGTEPEEDPDEFIDKKNLKLKPFGSKKKNKKGKKKGKTVVRAKDFDSRKNTLTMIKILRIAIIVFIVSLFGLGIKNTFFPNYVYTAEDIASISQEAIGQTGFPMNRGRALALQVATEYFNLDTDNDSNNQVLSQIAPKASEVTTSGTTKQKVLIQPQVYSEQAVDDKIAYYYVSALVSDRAGKSTDETGTQTSRWMGLAITVYFDSETQQLTVAPDSTQIIPSFEVGQDVNLLPAGTKLGTGVANEEIYDAMKSTINGYIQAYAASSANSHEAADQYVKTNADPSLFAGFGGEFTVDEESLTSESASVYPSSDEEGNNEWKVDLRITWEDATSTSPQDTVKYTGRYIMTLEKGTDSKYFVTAFRPYVYTPDETIEEE